MKKFLVACAVLLMLSIGGYFYARRAGLRPARALHISMPSLIHAPAPEPATGDLLKVVTACGRPRSDNTLHGAAKMFAGHALRTVVYGNRDSAKDGDTAASLRPVYLRFDQPAGGWRFRGASRGAEASNDDLSIDQLNRLLPCAARALEEEPPPTSAPTETPAAPPAAKAS